MIRKPFTVALVIVPLICSLSAQAAPEEPSLKRVGPADPGPVETVGKTPTAAETSKPVALPPAFTAEPSPPANIAYQALRGIVITRPGAKTARISLGENSTLRVGARVEYLRNGLQIATGRVVELNRGDALVSIEPEAADHYVAINTEVRIIENPAKNQGSTEAEKANREYSKFEKEFGISAAIAGAIYYAWIQD